MHAIPPKVIRYTYPIIFFSRRMLFVDSLDDKHDEESDGDGDNEDADEAERPLNHESVGAELVQHLVQIVVGGVGRQFGQKGDGDERAKEGADAVEKVQSLQERFLINF